MCLTQVLSMPGQAIPSLSRDTRALVAARVPVCIAKVIKAT